MRNAESDYKVIEEATDNGPEINIKQDVEGAYDIVEDNSCLTGHTLNQNVDSNKMDAS